MSDRQQNQYLGQCVDSYYKLIAPQGKLAMAKLALLGRQHSEPTVGEDALYVIVREPRRYGRLTNPDIRKAVSLALDIATKERVILPYRNASMTSDPDAVDTTIVQFGAWCYVDMVTSMTTAYMRFLNSKVSDTKEVFGLPDSMANKAVARFLDNRLREALSSEPFLAATAHLVYPALDLISG